MIDTFHAPVLCAALAAAVREVSAEGLKGLDRLLVNAYLARPRLYALGMVVGLLALGTAIGLVTEAVLTAIGRGTERITHHHE